jgi:hypothetical protein
MYFALIVLNAVYTGGQMLSPEQAAAVNPLSTWVESREATTSGIVVVPFAWAGKVIGFFQSLWNVAILNVPLMEVDPFVQFRILTYPLSILAVATIIMSVIGILRRNIG